MQSSYYRILIIRFKPFKYRKRNGRIEIFNELLMNKIYTGIILFILAILPCQLKAQSFFDTSDAEEFFSLGVRIGFNTSNKTFPAGHFRLWNKNNWGTGINVGAVANLNFKEYLTIQPGIFLESRSGNYSYLTNYLNVDKKEDFHYEMGNLRGYYVTVPIMGIVSFNLSENIKWKVEVGPYFQLALKIIGQNNVTVIYRLPNGTGYSKYIASHNSIDAGVKFGTGLNFYQHYYVGVHYLGGFYDVWKQPSGGRNKSWAFTIGYDF